MKDLPYTSVQMLALHGKKLSQNVYHLEKKKQKKLHKKSTGSRVRNLCFEFNICTLFQRSNSKLSEWKRTIHLNCEMNVSGERQETKQRHSPFKNIIAMKKQNHLFASAAVENASCIQRSHAQRLLTALGLVFFCVAF